MESPDDLLPEDNPLNAPREIMRLVNCMTSDKVAKVCARSFHHVAVADDAFRRSLSLGRLMLACFLSFARYVLPSIRWFRTAVDLSLCV